MRERQHWLIDPTDDQKAHIRGLIDICNKPPEDQRLGKFDQTAVFGGIVSLLEIFDFFSLIRVVDVFRNNNVWLRIDPSHLARSLLKFNYYHIAWFIDELPDYYRVVVNAELSYRGYTKPHIPITDGEVIC